MDYSALTQTPTKEQLDEFERMYPASAKARRKGVIAVALLVFMIFVFSVAGVSSLERTGPGSMTGSIILFGVIGLFAIGIIFTILGVKKLRRESAQLQLFATRNNLTYTREIESPAYQGMFFTQGRDRSLDNIIGSSTANPPFEIGNLKYTVGTGKNQHSYRMGYMRIKLERNLPHIVLDATSNNAKIFGATISNLPDDYDKSQRMSLEGDFDSHFSLYAPKEYKRDALYIFTPDVMALMIDNVKGFDAEIIDDQLFIYSAYLPFKLTDAVLLERLFGIIHAIGAKTSNQTDYYSDEKVGDRAANVVAVEGRRLKQRVPVITIIIIVIVTIIYALTSIQP